MYPGAPVAPRHAAAAGRPGWLGSGNQRRRTGTSVAARPFASALTIVSSNPATTFASVSPQSQVTMGMAPVAATLSRPATSTGWAQSWKVDRIAGDRPSCSSKPARPRALLGGSGATGRIRCAQGRPGGIDECTEVGRPGPRHGGFSGVAVGLTESAETALDAAPNSPNAVTAAARARVKASRTGPLRTGSDLGCRAGRLAA